jgi:hypothetical protein
VRDGDVAEVGAGRETTFLSTETSGREGARVDARLALGSRTRAALGVAGRDRHDDAALGAAVLLADDDVLRHVDEATGEVAGVRRTKSVSARPLRAPCVEMKYSRTVRPSRKLVLIGRGMISPLGFATRPRIPAI